MAGNARYLSGTNGFIPQATGQVISYIRDPKEFAINEYAQLIESPAPVGLYYRIDRDAPARIVTDEEHAWEDGAKRPVKNYYGLAFEGVSFICKRRDYNYQVGMQALATAEKTWNPLAYHRGMAAQMAMTNRTYRSITLMEASANWGNNFATATTLNNGAGTWDQASDDPASASYNAIRKTIMAVAIAINKATRSLVRLKDLRMLINPELATIMANSAEVHNYMKYGPFAQVQLEGKEKDFYEQWGLPKYLYGMEIVIEDTNRVSDRPVAGGGTGTNASTNSDYIKSTKSAIVLSQKGGLDGHYGAPSFSTFQIYWFDYLMSVFEFTEVKDQLVDGHVTEQFIEVLAAPESGYLIQNVVP